LEVPDGIGYAGVMLDCIEGMQSKEGRSLVLSVKNNGAIPFLKDEDVVEITCNVSEKGIIPVAAKNIPEDCKGLICLIKAYERLTVEAIEKKDAGIGARALAIHPLVNSYSIARELVKDYTEAYGKLF
ncbi:MAG: glycoside hydrolase, partial [Oscillospiraceae bacterium]